MIFRMLTIISVCLFNVYTLIAQQTSESMRYWPQWRGPLATGEAPYGDPPATWDEDTNIRWKVPLPGLGHATPVVWGDRIYISTAVPAGAKDSDSKSRAGRIFGTLMSNNSFSYEVLAINRTDGSLVWRRTARVEPPHEGRHEDASWASCSPVTDGEYVIASFGSRGFYCYDWKGNLLWEKDFGDLRIRFQWGEGSSPTLSGDKLIIPWDHDGDSFIVALDKKSGREIWRAKRNDGTSWATPLVVDHNGEKQVVASSIRYVRSFDFETGKELWHTRGMTANPIPSPVSANGIVYLMGGYSESILQAVSLDKAQGDAAMSKAIVWDYHQDTPYVPSPLLYEGNLYFIKYNQNMLSCLDAITGKPHYIRQRLNGLSGVYSSPVAAKDRVYIAGRNGVTIVFKHGPTFEVLSLNKLNDRFDASPVIVGKDMYLRGHDNLYCISEK
ncbi:MAG: PQQ-like beta-propeller repeat protein [Candidatus Latescibacteria bacterium]|nr:PQQ-like beta-propeller repeat protein [Candidatus Latescibacterota bacterium]